MTEQQWATIKRFAEELYLGAVREEESAVVSALASFDDMRASPDWPVRPFVWLAWDTPPSSTGL